MNSKLISQFDNTDQRGSRKPIYAIYLTLGYPDFETSVDLMVKLGQEGADIIEIGIPFSDPIADGPTIQYSSNLALQNGINLDCVWSAIERIKNNCSSKIVIMTYGNIILKYGVHKFVETGIKYGLDGLILPDVPPELYPEELRKLKPIHIISPNSELYRIEAAAKQTGLFLYLTSQLNVTGIQNTIDLRVRSIIEKIKNTDPNQTVLIGFGISNSLDVSNVMKLGGDGIIVGSVLIQSYRKSKSISDVIEKFRELKL